MAKILLQCHTPINNTMAGPSIRYWEFANILSNTHQVTLSAPSISISTDKFTLASSNHPIAQDVGAYDVIITQTLSHKMAWKAKSRGVKIIIDAYDPMPLENLELFKSLPINTRSLRNSRIIEHINFSFRMADAIICANSRQRDLWTGLLLALKCITPERYDIDNSYKKFIGIVPFGLPSTAPKRKSESSNTLRQCFNIPQSHFVILWGGGIWNWFDPITLIEAMHLIAKQRSDIHLVFMGLGKHPDNTPQMDMARSAVELAKSHKLYDKQVHFNFNWVPYDDRANFLLDADIGISTHFDHLETQYAFRTRTLDYLWASLPIISTEGDSFSDLIEKHNLGIAVPPQNPSILAKAILDIIDNPNAAAAIKTNIDKIKPTYYWNHVIKPLEEIIENLTKEHSPSKISHYPDIISSFFRLYGPRALWNAFRHRNVTQNKG